MKILLLIGLLPFLGIFQNQTKPQTQLQSEVLEKSNPEFKAQAFKVLQFNCNICHVKQNRKKVFTLENMDGFSFEINKQVFVKKRMPKGRKNKLEEKDKIDLKNWLNTLKSTTNE